MNADCLPEFVATDPVLAVGQHPKCRHPLVKTDRRVLEDRTYSDRELTFAGVAEPQFAGLALARLGVDKRVLSRIAMRALDYAIWPAIPFRVLKSKLGIGKVGYRFLQGFRSFKGGIHAQILH